MELTVGNLVKWFQLKYPKIVKEMHNSSHHYKDGEILNPYHLEGDVWTHNMMVMLEANRLKDKCDSNEFAHVLVAALLHDIGKPLARKKSKDKERVHFWGHEPLSAILSPHIIDAIIRDFKVKLNKRLIIECIAMHTDVYNIPREKLEARLISNRPLARLLSLLSDCDYAGRFFDMGERNMEMIVPKMLEQTKLPEKEVICMIGLPCSGKSTYIKQLLEDNENLKVLSRDDIVMELAKSKGIEDYNTAFKEVDQKEVDKLFQRRRNMYIQNSYSVIIDMTNMGRKSRRKNMHGFKDYAKTACVVMTSLENIHKRNEAREGKTIPDKVFERMSTSFQPPLYDEFDDIFWEFN
tara:strand:+ start:544 stop:1596 length:1053 start_codon:yes stop_codon:yes gene_type:complete